MPRVLSRFAVSSNVFYLIPLAVAAYYGLTLVAIALLFLFIFSTAFHVLKEEEFVRSDILAALVVLVVDVWLLYIGGLRPVPVTIVACIGLVAFAIRCFEHGKRGGTAHGFWHAAAALGTLICILSVTTSVFG